MFLKPELMPRGAGTLTKYFCFTTLEGGPPHPLVALIRAPRWCISLKNYVLESQRKCLRNNWKMNEDDKIPQVFPIICTLEEEAGIVHIVQIIWIFELPKEHLKIMDNVGNNWKHLGNLNIFIFQLFLKFFKLFVLWRRKPGLSI